MKNIFETTDWKLLVKQKRILNRIAGRRSVTKEQQNALQGIINLIDAIQDDAVDVHGIAKTLVVPHVYKN